MDTTHTTNTVEFVDWRAKAKAKLEDENKAFKGGREAQAVRDYILKTLIYFAARMREFDELKEKGSVIRTGSHAGQLLVDELMRDLMEVEQSAG